VKNKTSETENKYVYINNAEIMLYNEHICGWQKSGQALITTVDTAHLDFMKHPCKNINN
jgi:tmRNA-binding protein